jgi:3-oxoadipate enol-lactonase
MDFTTTDGITLHYQLAGTPDSPALVLINSLGTNFSIWDGVVAQLADRYHILRYDKRGHGQSSVAPAPYTIADHAGDLTALLDHVGWQQVVLIGVSVGGMISLDFVLRQPERVRALVLCDTGMTIGATALWNDRIAAVQANGLESIATAVLSRWFTPAFIAEQPAAYQSYYDMLIRTSADGYMGTCAALRDGDYRERVTTLHTPALVLCGAADQATPPDLNRALAAALPNSRFALIKNAGHLPCIEQPVAMAQVIETFLQDIQPDPELGNVLGRIILIGPAGVGKTTQGALLAQRLALPSICLDEIAEEYYEACGFGHDAIRQMIKDQGFLATYRQHGVGMAYASERMLAEYPSGVLDFGAGHSHFQDDELFARVRRALAPCKNVVLLLPARDLDRSAQILRARSKAERGWDWSAGGYDFIEHWVKDHCNHELATVTVYTEGKSPGETCDEIVKALCRLNSLPMPDFMAT